MLKYIKNVLQVFSAACVYAIAGFAKNGLMYRAASLAYCTILSIVPAMVILTLVISLFPEIAQSAEIKLQHFISNTFITGAGQSVYSYFKLFLSNADQLKKVNITFLVLINFIMLLNIRKSFNDIWQVDSKTNFSIQSLTYFIVLLFAPFALGGVLILVSFLLKLTAIQNVITQKLLKQILFASFTEAIIFVFFSFFNLMLPACKVKLKAAILGGAITTLIFELTKLLFTFYFNHFSTYRLLYGTLSAVPIFLIWLYFSWAIILFGALITKFFSTR